MKEGNVFRIRQLVKKSCDFIFQNLVFILLAKLCSGPVSRKSCNFFQPHITLELLKGSMVIKRNDHLGFVVLFKVNVYNARPRIRTSNLKSEQVEEKEKTISIFSMKYSRQKAFTCDDMENRRKFGIPWFVIGRFCC